MDLVKLATDFLANNLWLNAIFLFLAIMGIFATCFFYLKSERIRIPVYSIRNINLVKHHIKKIKSVEILYEGKKVNNLSISKLAFWNEGKETIDCKDIAVVDPLRIVLKNDAKVLDAEILFQKNEANNFRMSIDSNKNEINIFFDYIDYEEGVIIQIYHTAISNLDLEIKGKIKGTKNILRKKVPIISRIPFPIPNSTQNKILKSMPRRTLRFMCGIILLIIAIIVPFILFFFPELDKLNNNPIVPKMIGAFIVLFTYGGFGISLLKSRIPKGFDIFEEEF